MLCFFDHGFGASAAQVEEVGFIAHSAPWHLYVSPVVDDLAANRKHLSSWCPNLDLSSDAVGYSLGKTCFEISNIVDPLSVYSLSHRVLLDVNPSPSAGMGCAASSMRSRVCSASAPRCRVACVIAACGQSWTQSARSCGSTPMTWVALRIGFVVGIIVSPSLLVHWLVRAFFEASAH